ncbi:hypothetical protein [Bacillus safensis]|uniref:hypothetical protein n=1 Tax=Bacillus safensis TaxID=561879 RepID=UPI000D03DA14|nr:hypothetical protein [Bacillus safensis]PRS24220.1 hypothetical protein C6X94_03530 [Bacillus safensis]
MSPEETEVDWKDWIIEIALDFALPMAGEYISDLISQHFSQSQNKMEIRFKKAVDEVCSRVAELLDDAFKNQYLSDCRHVSNQLRIYQETHDRDVITNAQIESSRLASRLYDMGYKAAGGFFIAANMHLVSLRALSEIDTTYRNTLQEFTQDYIEKGIHLNSRLNDIATAFIPGACMWVIKPTKMTSISDGGSLSSSERDKLWKEYRELTGKNDFPEYINFGEFQLQSNGKFYLFPSFGKLFEIDNKGREICLQECNRIRQIHIDEKVDPLNNIINNTEKVLTNWRNWRIE